MLLRSVSLTLASMAGVSNAATASSTSTSVQVSATTTLTSPAEASSALRSLYATKPNLTAVFTDYIEDGLTTLDLTEAVALVKTPLSGPNGDKNENNKDPTPPAYPMAGVNDAPYDLTEQELRSALLIPSAFGCGSKGQPIILVPGTGTTGYLSFQGNYIPLLNSSDVADPVWLNIPGFLLGDAQTNAEYVAYAINYIYGICGQQVAVAAWSQGNIDAQWAYKYWPSTRSRVTDHIAFSPNYHGTVLLSSKSNGSAPVNLQQVYNSTFIQTLRSDGGDAAYVPTTVIYSGLYDEAVEPQQGKNASAYLLSSNEAEASNNEVQLVCPGQPAGSFYTHEGILYNPLGFALLKDALGHDGPGRTSRLDLNATCADYLTPGLTLDDLRLTENTIIISGLTGQYYPNKTTTEPPIKAYAQKASQNGTTTSMNGTMSSVATVPSFNTPLSLAMPIFVAGYLCFHHSLL